MGTHPIFESDFDCLTDSNRSEKWPPLKLQLLKRSEIKKFRITAQARKKLPRTKMSRLVKVIRRRCSWSTIEIGEKSPKGYGQAFASSHSRREPCLHQEKQVDLVYHQQPRRLQKPRF